MQYAPTPNADPGESRSPNVVLNVKPLIKKSDFAYDWQIL